MATQNKESTQLNQLDEAIRALMVDGKPRSAMEVAKILIKDGQWERQVVKNRLMVLVQRPDMYDRRNGKVGSKDVQYTMKRAYANSVKTAMASKEKKETPVKEPIAKSTVKETEMKAKPVIKSQLAEAFDKAHAKAPRVTDVDLKVSKDDSVNLAIWKVMHDGASYSAQDVAILVEHLDIKGSTISARMSTLVLNGWFDVDTVSRPKRYSLRANIEAPLDLPPYRRHITKADRRDGVSSTQDQNQDPQTKEIKDLFERGQLSDPASGATHAPPKAPSETLMQTAEHLHGIVPFPTAEEKQAAADEARERERNRQQKLSEAEENTPAPLVEVSVTIGGVALDAEETAELAHALQERGLLLPEDIHHDDLVTTTITYTIKGKSYSRAQAAAILFRLIELGF